METITAPSMPAMAIPAITPLDITLRLPVEPGERRIVPAFADVVALESVSNWNIFDTVSETVLIFGELKSKRGSCCYIFVWSSEKKKEVMSRTRRH